MRLERTKPGRGRQNHTEDVILFAIHETRFAIAANAVDEIRNLDGLIPFSLGSFANPRLARVRFTLTRDSKSKDGKQSSRTRQGQSETHFVVDAAAHYGIPSGRGARVLVLRDLAAAVLVDSIDRMMQISAVFPLPRAFSGQECDWYRGLALMEGLVVPVVKPESFLSKGELAVLEAGTKSSKSSSVAVALAKGAASA